MLFVTEMQYVNVRRDGSSCT